MTEGGASTRCLQALAHRLVARAVSGSLLLLLAFAPAACSSRPDDAKATETRAPMLDDDAIAHVQGIFAKGGIGIFSFDETKDACVVDPTTMSASAFNDCTGNVGLPTRVTTSIDEFDPSRALDKVYVVRAPGLDGAWHWFGVVGLGPSQEARDALHGLGGTWVQFGSPSPTPSAAGVVKPQVLPLLVGAAVLEGPELLAGAVLVAGAASAALTANAQALEQGVTSLIDRSAALLRSYAKTDADECQKAVSGSLDYGSDSVCLPLTGTERVALVSLANYWGTGGRRYCPYSAAYFAGGGANPGTRMSNADLLTVSGLHSPPANAILWNRDRTAEPRTSSFVLPHEYGHLLQSAFGTADLPAVTEELQATCLAGVFAGANRVAGLVAIGSLVYSCQVLLKETTVMANGTDADHGTCDQQDAAFAQGYSAAVAQPSKACSSSGKATDRALWALKTACHPAYFGGPGETPVQ